MGTFVLLLYAAAWTSAGGALGLTYMRRRADEPVRKLPHAAVLCGIAGVALVWVVGRMIITQ